MSEGDRPVANLAKEQEAITFAQFLESVPPSQQIKVTDLFVFERQGSYFRLETPQLQLHCTSATCNGLRFFRFKEGDRSLRRDDETIMTYLTYICSNCRLMAKMYSLFATSDANDKTQGTCYKFGEQPAYGPPTPPRLIRLFEKERETFLKGRQCENHGLGIGAFVYYRRVVENQKNRILDEVIRVSEKVGAPADIIGVLEAAKTEVQFSKALTSVKDAIPQALLINGHNPFTLLHRALSGGLHAKTDEQCLALAHDVRVVLVELAERLGQALKDEAELNTAVTRLMNANVGK
jgi:hypothetical protein